MNNTGTPNPFSDFRPFEFVSDFGFIRMKPRLISLLILLAFGAARMHFEQALTEEHRAAYFHGARLNLDLRQQLGQMGFLAALSGFRATVADVEWIEAHSAWERVEWGRMKLLFDTVTSLQPRCTMFWDMAAWHMAWNASVAAREDRRQPREALRIRAEKEYIQVGEDLLMRGIQNNPDKGFLYEKLGTLYDMKMHDPCRAADFYAKAATFSDSLPYVKRLAAFRLAECPGHDEEAYAKLVALYNLGKDERVPTLLTKLHELEEKLSVPPERRIYSPRQP